MASHIFNNCPISAYLGDSGAVNKGYSEHAYIKTLKLLACEGRFGKIKANTIDATNITTETITATTMDIGSITIDTIYVDPPETPESGKVAVFVGDIGVAGVIDPTGVQFVAQPGGAMPSTMHSVPYSNGANEGMLYVSDVTADAFTSNTLVYRDGTNTLHTMGDVLAPASGATESALTRFTDSTGKSIKNSVVTLSDAGELAVAAGDLSLTSATGNIILNATSDTKSVIINGSLNVQGTTYTTNSEIVNIKDNWLYLNDGYTSPASIKGGGIVINYQPTSASTSVTAPGFVAGVASVSDPTVSRTPGVPLFVDGDIIQISGSNNQTNDGVFEVYSDDGSTVAIRGIGINSTSQSFFQNQFITDGTGGGIITKITIFVMGINDSGQHILVYGSNSNTLTNYELKIENGGTGLSTYAAGDMIYASAANTLANLSIGTSGQLLAVSAGGFPEWTNTVDETHGGTGQTAFSTGDILYASGANTLTKLSPGSNGQVLTLSGGLPTWASATVSAPHYITIYNIHDNVTMGFTTAGIYEDFWATSWAYETIKNDTAFTGFRELSAPSVSLYNATGSTQTVRITATIIIYNTADTFRGRITTVSGTVLSDVISVTPGIGGTAVIKLNVHGYSFLNGTSNGVKMQLMNADNSGTTNTFKKGTEFSVFTY